ncbi:MAG: hypothetical protein Q8916_04190 [Bacteroidota bacterium]|nr:hypothetical protein [Bacteroidota bacterium]MDP4235547.1 hypothetical protein [Bacteroidota bacterium]
MADEFRSNYGAPQKQSGWSPVNVLSLVVGILGVMALTIILIAVLRRPNFHHMSDGMPHPPPPMMMTPNQPPQRGGMDSSRRETPSMNENQGTVPPPATMNEMERPSPKPRRHTSSRSSAFTTSNSVEAQEHLAEMRADGNTKARIRMKTKNGVTIYSVQ